MSSSVSSPSSSLPSGRFASVTLDEPPLDDPEALPREDVSCPNHCCDAGLYAYRAAWHYLHTEDEVKPKRGSAAFLKAEEELMESGPPTSKEWWDITEHTDEW